MKFRYFPLIAVSMILSGCGSMSFGDTALHTFGVLIEASEIKDCYDGGGDRELCEGRY